MLRDLSHLNIYMLLQSPRIEVAVVVACGQTREREKDDETRRERERRFFLEHNRL